MYLVYQLCREIWCSREKVSNCVILASSHIKTQSSLAVLLTNKLFLIQAHLGYVQMFSYGVFHSWQLQQALITSKNRQTFDNGTAAEGAQQICTSFKTKDLGNAIKVPSA